MRKKDRITRDEQYEIILEQLRKCPRIAAQLDVPGVSKNTIEQRLRELIDTEEVYVIDHMPRRGTYARIYAAGKGRSAELPRNRPERPKAFIPKPDHYALDQKTKDMLMSLDYFAHALVKRRASA